MTLLLLAMTLVKPLRILPGTLYPFLANTIAFLALFFVLLGCVLALLRFFRTHRRPPEHP